MKFVSPFLKTVLYPTLSRAGVFHRSSSPQGLAIVTYHGVLPEGYGPVDPLLDANLIPADLLHRQIALLKKHYRIVSPEQVLSWRRGTLVLPPRAVLVTCDDGLLNNLTDMLPVLEAESVRGLFFVTGAFAHPTRRMLWYEELFLRLQSAPAGKFEAASGPVVLQAELGSRDQRCAAWWAAVKDLSRFDADTRDRFLGQLRGRSGAAGPDPIDLQDAWVCRRFGLMTAVEIRQLAAAGMTIGAHTLSHPVLSLAPPPLAYAEIAESRQRLQAALDREVWAFAYPFGNAESVSEQVLTMPCQAGFAAGFLNCGGGLGTPLPAYALPRIHVTSTMSLGEFDAHVSGFYSWAQRKARRGPAVA